MYNTIENKGRLLGKRELVCKQLEKKFGALPQAALDRLDALPVERVEEIALSYTDAASLKELGLTDEESPGT